MCYVTCKNILRAKNLVAEECLHTIVLSMVRKNQSLSKIQKQADYCWKGDKFISEMHLRQPKLVTVRLH